MTLIKRNDLGEVARWELPSIDPPQALESEPMVPEPPTEVVSTDEPEGETGQLPGFSSEELEAMREAATLEGFQAGYREGQTRAGTDIAERLARLSALISALTSPLEALDQEIERDLLQLVVRIARQLVRRELSTQPEQIVAVLRDALLLLPINQRQIRVHLNPEDAHLVEELLHLEERPWRIEEDPLLSRGGCRVTSDTSQIDASVEHRMGELIARVLGDQRR